MRGLLWCCVALLLSACQPGLQRTETGLSGIPERPPALRRLVDFSTRFEQLAQQEQRTLCDSMRLSLKRDAPGITGWYLATAISRVEGCGERSEAIQLIQHLLNNEGLEREAVWLARYQLELLQQQEREQTADREERQRAHSKLQQAEDRARQLEEKLNDLKRIETSINKRLDEQQPAE